MRALRLLVIVIYVASTVGVPENLGLPGSGCRCASEEQQSGNCCCSAKRGTGSCGGSAEKPETESASCENCLSAKGAAVASQGCCSSREATGKNPKAARYEDGAALEPCVSEGFVTNCSCGSTVPGSLTVDDPRLMVTTFDMEGPSIVVELLLLRDSSVAEYSTAPETPPPKTA